MDGSANFNSKNPKIDGQYNAAISPRQPGSSFKPIVFATAFQMGWYPGIVLPDVKTYFPQYYGPQSGNPQSIAYVPPDYGGAYNNQVWPIHKSLQNSFNVPAVKALMYAGNKNVLAMAERMGITGINPRDLGPSFALGTTGVSLLQMVGAYQVFANQGMRVPPQGVLDIWDNYGHNIYHFDPHHPQGVQVISQQIAFMITSMLTDENARSYEFSTDHVLSMWDWTQPDGTHPQVAAKTGTTDSFRDNWTLGYTSNVVVGVWSGNADNSTMNGVIGITGAAPIWHSVIERVSGHCEGDPMLSCGTIHTVLPPQSFPTPPGVVQQTVSAQTGLYGTGYTDWMLQADIPQPMSGDNGNGNGNQNGNQNGTLTPSQ
jgi:membrane peptidoglycan carboxypeptidase